MTDDDQPTKDYDASTDETEDDLPAYIVSPEDGLSEDTHHGESVAERAIDNLSDELKRDFRIADDSHPLVRTAGTKEALLSNTPVKVQQLLADKIYQEEDVFFREYKQNAIAACVREAKRIVKEQEGRRALSIFVRHEHPALDEARTIQLPKLSYDILDMARQHGYQPVIEFTMNHDTGMLTVRDNGIAMTTAEVIDLWNEPAESGSGNDLSSAGNLGIGSLTWVTIAGEENAIKVKTRTRRTTTLKGEPVPGYDRAGFWFYTFFGGLVPIPGDIEDGFFGTIFELPVREGLNPHSFKDSLARYCDILPVQVTWTEIEGGVADEDEFPATRPKEQYDREPLIQYERPGEFTAFMDTSTNLPQGSRDTDTWLLDNPISRNVWSSQRPNTYWNDHLVIHNEQGLIVAGPNRGRRHEQVDELYGELEDITDDEKAMPDIPLPEPTGSRDQLERGEAHERFFAYYSQLLEEREQEAAIDYINAILDADTLTDALAVFRTESAKYDLFRHVAKSNGGSSKAPRMYDWFTGDDDIDIEDTVGLKRPELVGHTSPRTYGPHRRRQYEKAYDDHEKWPHIQMLALMSEMVDRYSPTSTGDPNNKSNRKRVKLGTLIGEEQQYPIFIGATLNADRVEVIHHNFPDALVFKTNTYDRWLNSPLDVRLVKHVPKARDEDHPGDYSWDIPDAVHQRNKRSTDTTTTSESDDGPQSLDDRPLKFRTKKNTSVDIRTTVAHVKRALDATPFGDTIRTRDNTLNPSERLNLRNPYIVVFPSTSRFNISDYWHLIGEAAIVKTTMREAEALLRYPQVFTPDDFTSMLMDASFRCYDPFTDEYGTVSPMDVIDQSEDAPRNVFIGMDEHQVISLLTNYHVIDMGQGHPALGFPRPTNLPTGRTFAVARKWLYRHVAGMLGVQNPLADDANTDRPRWRLVFWENGTDSQRATAFWNLYAPRSAYQSSVWDTSMATAIYTWDTDSANRPPGSQHRLSALGTILSRAEYPQWDHDSTAWERLNGSSHGYNNSNDKYEQALHEAMRDIYLDHYAEGMSPERLRRVVYELVVNDYDIPRVPDSDDEDGDDQ